jgi:hypothetical protein
MVDRVELVDPAAEFRARQFARAPGPVELAGRRVALLGNGKWNAAELLDDLASLLEERHGVSTAFRNAKQHYNHELSADAREEVLASADFALLAIGD